MKNLIISSIGSPAGYGVVKGLKGVPDFKLIGLDASEQCYCRKEVDQFYTVPKVLQQSYLRALEKIIEKEKCDLFIPTIQPELRLIPQIKQFARVLSSSDEAVNNCTNKINMYRLLSDNRLNEYIPGHLFFNSQEGLKIDELFKIGYPDRPISIKPSKEHGGIAFKNLNIGLLEDVVDSTFTRKNLSWRTFDELSKMLTCCEPIDLIASEYLPGPEYSVDILVVKGKVELAVPRKRTRVSGGIVVQGIVEENMKLIEASRKIVPLYDLDYFVNIQFKYTGDGLPKLIDMNPRFCGSHIMSLGAGVNFPLLTVRAAFNEAIIIPEPQWGTGMIRYWESCFFKT